MSIEMQNQINELKAHREMVNTQLIPLIEKINNSLNQHIQLFAEQVAILQYDISELKAQHENKKRKNKT